MKETALNSLFPNLVSSLSRANFP